MNPTFLNHPLSVSTPSYGNRDKVIIKPGNQISEGDTANTTEICLTNNHIGTHVDVPKHFYDNGKTLTDLKASEWMFEKISMIDIGCNKGRLIQPNDFDSRQISPLTDFLIIRTGFEKFRSEKSYWNAYPGISPEACNYLRENFSKLRAVGFDFISLTSPLFKEEGKEAHRIFLKETGGNFILIVEDMKLSHLSEAPDKLILSPLIIEKGNGGPVTIFAYT